MTLFYANTKKAWKQASDADREMGRKAYPIYRETLSHLASYYSFGFVQTVEAFVALSPNNDYHGNLRSLVTLMDGMRRGIPLADCTVSTYRACAERAWGYLSGDVSFLDTVKGRKITSFRHNILYLGRSNMVTVDGHMVAIAHGRNMTMKEANAAMRIGRTYDDTERAVLSLARKYGEDPCAVQATLWTWRKRSLGIKIDTQIDLFTGTTKWDGVIPPDQIKPYGS